MKKELLFLMKGEPLEIVYIPFERDGCEYVLIDTAGVRRRGKTSETVEKFSVLKTRSYQ